jgi:hypothetical protein
VNRRLALLLVFLTLVGTAIEGANMLNQFVPLVLLDSQRYTGALTVEQLQALAYLPLEMLTVSYATHIVFFGCYGLTIGYLVYRSTFLPRAVGVLMTLGGMAYLISSFAIFLAPSFAAQLFPYIGLPSLVGEGSLCLSLLVIGVNVQRWQERASAAGIAGPGGMRWQEASV